MTAATTTRLGTGTWAIDPDHSSISFWVKHLMVSKIRGRFERFSGTISVDDNGMPSVHAEIAIDSIKTGNEQRDAHLQADDFFDAQIYPVATFTSNDVQPDGDNYVLNGDFTLRGVTKSVSLQLVFNGLNPGAGQGQVAGFAASIVLDRRDFGIAKNKPLEGGGTLVGENVTINLDVEAVKQD